MHWLTLPLAGQNKVPAFADPQAARNWLASQPQAQAMHMLAALREQIEAIDAAPWPPGQRLELLNLLRAAALPALDAIEPRFLRKALPLADADRQAFEASQGLWLQLGIAYLRLATEMPAGEQCLPLQRAANALRCAGFCYFQAACDYPPLLDRLLFGVLSQATAAGVLTQPLVDPDFPHYGEANIAGHAAWAFLLRLIDPYRLSAAQLTVANRALSRWRELAEFQAMPSDDPKAHSVDLSPLFDEPKLPPGVPRWLEIRKVEKKMLQRIKALQDGETPEALKLGRELSAAACIRLLKQLDEALEAQYRPESNEAGSIELAFGSENAYAIFRDEALNPTRSKGSSSSAIAHQRMEIFGFDRLSQLPTAVKKLNVPSENWILDRGRALRLPSNDGERRQSPCLIASKHGSKPRLGVMLGLRTGNDGSLTAELFWFEERIEAGLFARRATEDRDAPRTAAFLLHDGPNLSLLAPANAVVRLDVPVQLEGLSVGNVVPTLVLERGVDFVRYEVTPR